LINAGLEACYLNSDQRATTSTVRPKIRPTVRWPRPPSRARF